MFSSKKRSSLWLFSILLIAMTSCSRSRFCQESVEVPCHWHTPLEKGVTDGCVPYCWWETLGDSQLTELVERAMCRNYDILLTRKQSEEKKLETVNSVIAETAKTYVEMRGLQQRLKSVRKGIENQNKIVALEETLSESTLSPIEQKENKKSLNSLLIQHSLVEVSLKKVIFHLSTLLSYPPGELCDSLYLDGGFPKLPCDIPIGTPCDLVEEHPSVLEAKKLYITTLNEQAFYNYQKTLLAVLEEAENALAAFLSSRDKIGHLENSKRLKEESYQLTKDLFDQGFKDERDVLAAQQELLAEEMALSEGKTELLIHYVNLQRVLFFRC